MGWGKTKEGFMDKAQTMGKEFAIKRPGRTKIERWAQVWEFEPVG